MTSLCVGQHRGQEVQAERPHLCDECRMQFARRLAELPALLVVHRVLHTGLGPAWSPGREPGSGERALPGERLLAADGPAALGIITGEAPDKDQDAKADPVWSTVAGLAGVVAAERDLQPPRTRDLAVLVTWLAPHTEWLADHVAADEHAEDVRRVWSGLRRSTGVGKPRPRSLPQAARCPMCERGGHLWLLPVTHRPETDAHGVPVHPQPVVVECLRQPDDLGEKGCGHVIREQDMPRWVQWLEALDRDARRERLLADRRHRAEVEAQERRTRRQDRGAA